MIEDAVANSCATDSRSVFRSPSMLDRLGPYIDRDESRLLEQRSHLLSAVAAIPIVDCGQLDHPRARCLQLVIPNGARRGLCLRPPCNRAHGASWLQHPVDLCEALFRPWQLEEDEGDD